MPQYATNINAIEYALTGLNMSQRELAKKLGVTGAAISQWASEKRTPPPKIIWKIAKMMNMRISELLELSGTDASIINDCETAIAQTEAKLKEVETSGNDALTPILLRDLQTREKQLGDNIKTAKDIIFKDLPDLLPGQPLKKSHEENQCEIRLRLILKKLSDEGQHELIKRAEELTQLSAYKKQ